MLCRKKLSGLEDGYESHPADYPFRDSRTLSCSSRPVDAASAGSSASSATATPAAWVRYYDPSEHSFSLEIPRGWSVEGGMYRFGYFDVRATVDLRSPDGNIILVSTTPTFPLMRCPDPPGPRKDAPMKNQCNFR